MGNYAAAVEAYDRALALDPHSIEANQNRERAIELAQGSGNATLSTTAIPAGEPVPCKTLLALAVGTVGLAFVSRSRGN
jgi:hypothetical protein